MQKCRSCGHDHGDFSTHCLLCARSLALPERRPPVLGATSLVVTCAAAGGAGWWWSRPGFRDELGMVFLFAGVFCLAAGLILGLGLARRAHKVREIPRWPAQAGAVLGVVALVGGVCWAYGLL